MEHNRNDGHNTKVQVLIQPNIGLDSDVRHSVLKFLTIALADEAVLTAKTRCALWNVRGTDFYELHTLFETQYQLLNNVSNDIAERVRMLGGYVIGSHAEFLNHTRLEEQPGVIPTALRLLADHEASIRFLREDSRKCTEDYEDEGSFVLLVRIMSLHEKMAWMLRSLFENETVHGESQKGI